MTRFSTFTEGDTRIFIPATMSDAVRKVRSGEVDGMTVDIVDDSGDYQTSYEVQPGRPIVGWHNEECWFA